VECAKDKWRSSRAAAGAGCPRLQEQYAVAQVGEAEQFVRLYKSLGGGWQNYQAIPAIRQPQPVIIAAFRRLLSPSTP
jgi:hypothetical protein